MSTTTDPTTETDAAGSTAGTPEAAELRSVEHPVVIVTEAALDTISGIREAEDDPAGLVLRIAVNGINGIEYTYDLSFEPRTELEGELVVYDVGDLTVAIPEDSVEPLQGATLDLPSNPGQAGLVIRNPNRPNPLAGKVLELVGDLPEKVTQLLVESINPSLASHGGFAELVGVEDDKVYVRMGGGCQGCAMSQATLVEGISKSIREAIPEVTDVIDVTDHASGDNPFYT